jgi:hypothetical protein
MRSLKAELSSLKHSTKDKSSEQHYCYLHGYLGHNGSICTIMEQSTDPIYSPSQIAAKKHTDVKGGSTRTKKDTTTGGGTHKRK